MISSSQEFEDATAFEMYALGRLLPQQREEDAGIIVLHEGKIIASAVARSDPSGATVDCLKDELAPLMFGAAWKILDLLVEWSLFGAGLRPKNGSTWPIAEKQRLALGGQCSCVVLGCSQPVWNCLLQAYAATVEHRHCLVHRTADVNSASGALTGVHSNGKPLTPISREEQIAFAHAACVVARGVGGEGLTQRLEDHLKHYLNQLAEHTGASAFDTPGASAAAQIEVSLQPQNGKLLLDVPWVMRARSAFPSIAHFNLLITVADGSGRQLFGHVERCPEGLSIVDLDALPTWLQMRPHE